MKNIILILLLFIGGIALTQEFERKIIIEDGLFYYVSVDENIQIATLYKGEMDGLLKEAKAYAIPAGRGLSAQTNPLAWDIDGDELYAVNFMDNSMLDRFEAIKKFELNDLKLWGANVHVNDVIIQSLDEPQFVFNEPYRFLKERSDYLNHFYFDGLYVDGAYWMAVTNNQELTVWKHADGEWKRSEVMIDFKVDGPFTLVELDDKVYFITQVGKAYELSISKGAQMVTFNASATFNLKELVMIENRDTQSISYMKRSQFSYEKSMKDMISDLAVKLKFGK